MKLVVIFHRLGPYHHARLRAAAQVCHLSAIELSAVDETYAWDQVDGAEGFERHTLFMDSDVADKQTKDIQNRLFPLLAGISPDVIFINGWADKSAILALAWGRRYGIPCVIMSESTEIDVPRVWWQEKIKSAVVKQCSAGFVGGKLHVEYLVKLGVPQEFVYTGYDVVDNEYFSKGADVARTRAEKLRAEKSLPGKFFLNSSRFIEKKNLSRLIDAYAKYQALAGERAWHLVIIGDGELRSGLEKQICSLGLQAWIYLPGFKQYDELPLYYGLASCYVQASTTEQWGLVVNEAMASGLPVLVSDRCGCTPDLVRAGENGFTFDPYNVDVLTGLMLKVSSGECDLVAMGQASTKIVADWTPETFAKNLLAAASTAAKADLPQRSWLDSLILKALINR